MWLIEVKDNDFEAYRIAMVATSFSAALLTVPLICLISNYLAKKSYKFRMHKLVEENLTFKVYVNGTFRYHIIQIEKILDKNISYIPRRELVEENELTPSSLNRWIYLSNPSISLHPLFYTIIEI